MQKKMDYNEIYKKERLQESIEKIDEKELNQDLGRFLWDSERKIIPELKRLTLERLKNINRYDASRSMVIQ